MNLQMFGDFPIRHFGRTIHLSAEIDPHGAAVTTWPSTCQALQEKIKMLVSEMDTLRDQNDTLARKCITLECKVDCQEGELEYLRMKAERLSQENNQLYKIRQTPPTPVVKRNQVATKPIIVKSSPRPITKIIDSIHITSDKES